MQAIAINGHLPDALGLYDEIKQGGGSLEPKSLVNVMVSFTAYFICNNNKLKRRTIYKHLHFYRK